MPTFMHLGRRVALAATLLAAVAVHAAEPAPDETGSAYSVQDFDWRDAGRDRAVPVRLYLPESASAEHPVPLVVFSHGIGGSRAGYSYLGRAGRARATRACTCSMSAATARSGSAARSDSSRGCAAPRRNTRRSRA